MVKRTQNPSRLQSFANAMQNKFPALYGSKSQQTISGVKLGLSSRVPLDKKQIPAGFVEHSAREEYERLLQDSDMRTGMGMVIANFFSVEGYTQGEMSLGFVDGKPIEDSYKASSLENSILDYFVDKSMEEFALKAINAFSGVKKRWITNPDKSFIISLPGSDDGKSISPIVSKDVLSGVTEALQRTPLPYSENVTKMVNIMHSDQYSGPKAANEIAHYNFATQQVSFFIDKLTEGYEKYQNAHPDEKETLNKHFSDPEARKSLESFARYVIAHEMGHMVAGMVWDYKAKREMITKNASWRMRYGLQQLQKEMQELKAKDGEISKYGEESADEYFAEKYAQFIFSGKTSEAFKQILDKHGIVRGKAKKVVSDESSSNPAARTNLPDTKETYRKAKNDDLVSEEAYIGAYGEAANLDGLSLSEINSTVSTLNTALASYYSGAPKIKGNTAEEIRRSIGQELYAIMRGVFSSWNGSSNTAAGLALMDAISELFDVSGGLPISGRTTDPKFAAERLIKLEKYKNASTPETIALFKRLVKAHYEQTQKLLEKYGIDETVVYRGWRAATDLKGKASIPTRPVSSFSLSPDVAQSFASGNGATTAVIVPRRKIFGYYGTNSAGVEGEQEVLIIGGNYEMHVFAPGEVVNAEKVLGLGKEIEID